MSSRGVREELDELVAADVIIEAVRGTYLVTEEQIESPSYPSLVTQYKLHTIVVWVSLLPAVNLFYSRDDQGRGQCEAEALLALVHGAAD